MKLSFLTVTGCQAIRTWDRPLDQVTKQTDTVCGNSLTNGNLNVEDDG